MNKCTGIILAGGKSSRMGQDKAWLPFPDKPLIKIMLDKLVPLFEQMLIITNSPENYQGYSIKTEQDIIPGCGPLGGIYTALLSSQNEYNFIVACDMPFLSSGLVGYLREKSNGFDVVVPEYNNKLEPLCAVYSKNCIEPIKNRLNRKNFKITDFFPLVKVKKITDQEIKDFDPEGDAFMNINRPDDYNNFVRGKALWKSG